MFTPTEQLIGAVARRVNQRPALKRCSHVFLRRIGAAWVHFCSRNLLRVDNVAPLAALSPDRGVIIASNHRSYADMYLLSSVLLPRCGWIERTYFPVRSEFIYDHIGGLVANALIAGMAMYPPVYRQPARRALNRDTVAFLVNELGRRGTVVGMHPEGRRSTTADPYTLLPAQPGLGEIVHRAQPLVIPAFIAGVPDNLFEGIRANFRGATSGAGGGGSGGDHHHVWRAANLRRVSRCAAERADIAADRGSDPRKHRAARRARPRTAIPTGRLTPA